MLVGFGSLLCICDALFRIADLSSGDVGIIRHSLGRVDGALQRRGDDGIIRVVLDGVIVGLGITNGGRQFSLVHLADRHSDRRGSHSGILMVIVALHHVPDIIGAGVGLPGKVGAKRSCRRLGVIRGHSIVHRAAIRGTGRDQLLCLARIDQVRIRRRIGRDAGGRLGDLPGGRRHAGIVSLAGHGYRIRAHIRA